jgi:pyruvate formate lyase activating enzyme
MQAPPTPHKSLLLAYEIARENLDFVYVGNVDSDVGNDTCCPSCKTVLIRRNGYSIFVNGNITQNPASGTAVCPSCNYQTNVVIA